MRLFYDSYSSRLRAEIALLAADALAISSAVLYVTDAVDGRGPVFDKALLVLWACMPRALAKILGRLDRPSSAIRLYAGALSFVALTVLLILSGWELIGSAAPRERPVGLATVTLIFFAWGAGFLLFHARAYRLHDFLLAAAFLLGLKEGKPYALAWMPLFFAGIFSSSTLRHLVYDAFLEKSAARFNLQNARTVALLAALAASILFLGGYYTAQSSSFFIRRARPERIARDAGSLARGEASKAPEAFSPDLTEGAQDGGREREEPTTKEKGKKRVGFSHRISLRDLALARFDNRVVLRVRPVGDGPDPRAWRPTPSMLWKGISFSTFDAQLESWVEETEYRQGSWPANGKLSRPMEQAFLATAGNPLLLSHQVVTPVLRTLVLPYFTLEIAAEKFAMYRESSLGDLLPSPKLAQATEYFTLVAPLVAGDLPPKPAFGASGEPRFLAVPRPEELGVNLALVSRQLFPNPNASIQEKVRSLRSFLSKSFRYSNQALWRTGKSPLGAFLEKEKIGDCAYFATAAALILRAGGVSTRLVAGFVGGAWDEEKGEALIRNREAHAWVEHYLPGSGWFPLDATSWVELDPSYRLPPDALAALAPRLSRGGFLKSAEEVLSLPPLARADSPANGEGKDRGIAKSSFPASPPAREASPVPLLESAVEARGADGFDADPVLWIEYSGVSLAENKAEAVAALRGQKSAVFEPPTAAQKAGSRPGTAMTPEQKGEAREALGILLRALLVTFGALVSVFLVLAFLRPRKPSEEKKGEAELGPEGESGDLEPLTAYLELEEGSPRDRIIAEYARLQESLKLTRSHRRLHQTPLEHARAVTRGRDELEDAFLQLHRVLYRAVYANDPVDDHHLAAFVRSCRRVRRILV